MATTGLIKIHEHNSTGNKDDYWAYWSVTVSSINSKIQSSGIPANATIDRVGLVVNSDYNGGLGTNPCKAYLQFGFSNATNSISDYVLTDTRITKEPTNYPSDQGVDVTNRFDKANRKFNSSVGTYFVMCVHTESSLISAQKAQYAYVVVDYTPHTHSYTSSVIKVATCTETGTRRYTCSCGDYYDEVISKDPNNHAGGTEIRNSVSATCTATGYTGDTHCKGCGAKLSSGSTIAKKSHTEVTLPAVAPTCTETGLTAGKKCSVCGTIITAQQSIPALGHTYSAPSITLAGRKFTCSCGHSYEERAYDIGFDNIFSLADWIHSSSSVADRGSVAYDIHNGTITTTSFTKAEADAWIAGASNRTESQALDCYTKYANSDAYFNMAVKGNTQYTVSFNIDNDNGQCYVFFYKDDGSCSPAHYNLETTAQLLTGLNKRVFTTPSDCTKVQIRFGSNAVYGTSITFSNIRICESSMEDIINEKYRKVFFANETIGELSIPERDKYTFIDWYTDESGTGTKITTSSKFTQSIIAYSLWELSRINNILIDTRQSSEVLLNLQEADEIYKDLIKVYG